MLKKFLIGTLAVVAFAVVAVSTSSAAYDLGPTTLKVGSTGPYVMTLQTVVGANPDGVFGQMTKAKVMAWQSNHGLVADGVVGPMTKAAMNSGSTTADLCPNGMTLASNCTVAPNGGSTGTLAGTDGTISKMNQLSQYNNEEVGGGQSDVKVMGFDIQASADGDISIKSIKLTFDAYGNASGDSDRLTDYLDMVTVYMGSTEVASASTDDFTKDSTGIYSKTFTLSGNTVIRADETAKFYVAVDAVSNLDSGDIDSDSWTVALSNLRYVDGSGVVTTETSAIPAAIDYDNAGDGVGIAFVSFSTASDTDLKITLASSSPESQVVEISTSSDTDDVVLLKGNLKLEGTSDVWLDQLPIVLVTDGDSLSAFVSSVTLTIGDDEYSESTGSNCVSTSDFSTTASCDSNTTAGVVFDNLDIDLNAGSTVTFTVKANVNDIENSGVTATDFDEGDTLYAALTSGARAYIVAENEEPVPLDGEVRRNPGGGKGALRMIDVDTGDPDAQTDLQRIGAAKSPARSGAALEGLRQQVLKHQSGPPVSGRGNIGDIVGHDVHLALLRQKPRNGGKHRCSHAVLPPLAAETAIAACPTRHPASRHVFPPDLGSGLLPLNPHGSIRLSEHWT